MTWLTIKTILIKGKKRPHYEVWRAFGKTKSKIGRFEGLLGEIHYLYKWKKYVWIQKQNIMLTKEMINKIFKEAERKIEEDSQR